VTAQLRIVKRVTLRNFLPRRIRGAGEDGRIGRAD
jgi:hypothetical protein